MSDKEVIQTSKKPLSNVLKGVMIVLVVAVLEVSAIIISVFVTESRQAKNIDQIQSELNKVNQHSSQIANLTEVAKGIIENNQKIATNSGEINLLTENLNALKAEVGNKRLDLLTQQMTTLTHQVESMEEAKSNEALVLSLALIIKENALYNRGFKNEADILKELSVNQPNVQQYVDDVVSLRETVIVSDTQLIDQFFALAENLSFESSDPKGENDGDENRSAVSKSIKLIKDTVSNINFDKVVVLKKDTKTNEQKLLVHTLAELVKAHNFADAIEFINQNPDFNNVETDAFLQWRSKLQQKVLFDKAISNLIASELNAMRQDFQTLSTSQNEE